MELAMLRSKNASDRIALRGVRMHSILAAMSQKTVVEQSFLNRESHAIEAVYTFPLPDGTAVCGFEIITGDRVLTGVIEETDTAIEKYESAVAAGDAAYLAEQERPDVFTIRVGNIKPRQAATVRLTYVCPLDANDNQIRVAFPTTLAPRYAASAGTDPLDAAIDADALNPPHVLNVPYGLTFSADVKLGRKIKQISSPSHPINVTGDDREGYHISLPTVAAMDRELVLSIELAKEVGPSVQYEIGKDNQSFLAVTFVPEFAIDPSRAPAASETVFLLDCSGSMAGNSIAQATAALELCLRSLNLGDAFNICKFGSRFELLSLEPLTYTQETLERAIAYIANGNDLGGTELHAPLETILRPAPAVGAVRNVIVLTDGQVTNEPAILQLARRQRGRNRIFSFGIGPACSTFLVKGLARATGGAAEFISSNERIEEKVLRTFARLASPMASDVQIDWDGAEAQTLAELPPIFDGEVMTVFARVLGRRPSVVTLKCRTEAGAPSWRVDLPAAPLEDAGIAAMWARRTIQSLEEVNGVSRTATIAKGTREREMLVAISKEFNLLSSVTTFVAIEHRSLEERNDGKPATQRVPVMLAAGWGGAAPPGPVFARDGRRVSFSRLRRAVDAGGMHQGTASVDFDAARGGAAAPAAAPVAPMPKLMAARPRQESAPGGDGPGSELSEILKRQSAEGDFAWDARLEQIAGSIGNWKSIAAKIDALNFETMAARSKVNATFRALALLRTRFAAEESLWKRAADKAVRYVAKATGWTIERMETDLRIVIA